MRRASPIAVIALLVTGCSGSGDASAGPAEASDADGFDAAAEIRHDAPKDVTKDVTIKPDGLAEAMPDVLTDGPCVDMTYDHSYSGPYVCDQVVIACTQAPTCKFTLVLTYDSWGCPGTCNHVETLADCQCHSGVVFCSPLSWEGMTTMACCDCPVPPPVEAGSEGGCTANGELCNGLDDNCNGLIDEGDPGGGATCETGKLGVCAAGGMHCVNGALECVETALPSTEVCDGLDNNCNGQVDESDPNLGAPCSTAYPGVCVAGHEVCDGSLVPPALACQANLLPSQQPEVCNGLDNDCNGVVGDGCPNVDAGDAGGGDADLDSG